MFLSAFHTAYAADSGPVTDSGPALSSAGEAGEPDSPADTQNSLLRDIAAIREYLYLLVYFWFPVSYAFLLVYLFCSWFGRTFLGSAL